MGQTMRINASKPIESFQPVEFRVAEPGIAKRPGFG